MNSPITFSNIVQNSKQEEQIGTWTNNIMQILFIQITCCMLYLMGIVNIILVVLKNMLISGDFEPLYLLLSHQSAAVRSRICSLIGNLLKHNNHFYSTIKQKQVIFGYYQYSISKKMFITGKTVFLGRLYTESYDIYTVSTLCTSSLS